MLIISSIIILRNYKDYKESKKKVNELIENVIDVREDKNIDIDWKKLLSINPDIIGWIKINNTNINYPILQDDNNLKYMKLDFYKNYNMNGSIFTIDSSPFEKIETTIYGHNMKTGLMFSDLGKYMDKNFLEQHLNFEIYTKKQKYKATIFSCYSIGIKQEENNIKALDYENRIEYYKKASKHHIENVGEIKKIIKLSTCSYINNRTVPTNQRYFIIAKLENI